jgi:mannose-6-phosphate isomerase-like protein (cupin superfamily)
MRRVVTGTVDGLSTVVEDGTVVSADHWDDLWIVDADDDFGRAPEANDFTFTAPPGGLRWRIFKVPTEAQMKAMFAGQKKENPDAEDTKGYHQTNTVDLLFVLEGEITLELENGSAELHEGDLIVQRGTNHAWRNYGDKPVKLLGIMRTLPA